MSRYDDEYYGWSQGEIESLTARAEAAEAEREKLAMTALHYLSALEFMVWAPNRIRKRDMRQAITKAKEPFLMSGTLPAYETTLTETREKLQAAEADATFRALVEELHDHLRARVEAGAGWHAAWVPGDKELLSRTEAALAAHKAPA